MEDGPGGEGWIAEEGSDLSNEEEWISLGMSSESMHFQMAQAEDSEL